MRATPVLAGLVLCACGGSGIEPLWSRVVGPDAVSDIALGSSGRILAALGGNGIGAFSELSGVAAIASASGDVIWTWELESPMSNVHGIAATPEGAAIVFGNFAAELTIGGSSFSTQGSYDF